MNPKFKPTAEQRKMVHSMCGRGIPQADIAIVLGIDPKTLRLHFRRELDTGVIHANARVAETLYRQATDRKNPSIPAAIFWLKARAGWREKHEVEVSGPGGGPVVFRWADAAPIEGVANALAVIVDVEDGDA